MINSYLTLSLLMIANGVLFFPPSEYLYFDGVMLFDHQYSVKYFLLPIGNSLGHLLFFHLIRFANNHIQSSNLIMTSRDKAWGNALRKTIKIARKIERYSHDYFLQYGNKYYSVMFGRLVPCVHTAICMPAALSSITTKRYFTLTLIGNFIYSLACLLIILLTPPGSSYKSNLLNAVFVFGVIYVLHLIHYAKMKSSFQEKIKGDSRCLK